MATRTKQSGEYRDINHKEIFIESPEDLATLPQIPQEDFPLGSVAYDKDFNIWTLTSGGWEESE